MQRTTEKQPLAKHWLSAARVGCILQLSTSDVEIHSDVHDTLPARQVSPGPRNSLLGARTADSTRVHPATSEAAASTTIRPVPQRRETRRCGQGSSSNGGPAPRAAISTEGRTPSAGGRAGDDGRDTHALLRPFIRQNPPPLSVVGHEGPAHKDSHGHRRRSRARPKWLSFIGIEAPNVEDLRLPGHSTAQERGWNSAAALCPSTASRKYSAASTTRGCAAAGAS